MCRLAVAATVTAAMLAGAGSARAAFTPVPGELGIVIARTDSAVVVEGRMLRPLRIPRLPRTIPYVAPGRVRNRSGVA